jgi:hypothetical protein
MLAELDGQITKAMNELEFTDRIEDLFDDGQSADKLPPELAEMKDRQKKMNVVLEELREADAGRRKNGIDTQKNSAQRPKTDLDSRILPNKEGSYAPNDTPMCVNELINGFIVDADVVVGNVEHTCLATTVDLVGSQYGVSVETMMADTAYSTGQNLTAMEDRNVGLLSPLAEVTCADNPAIRDDPTQPVAAEDVAKLPRNASSKVFDRQAFVYDEEQDCYHCPEGRTLNRRGTQTQQRASGPALAIIYECDDCSNCSMASGCRQKVDSPRPRRVARDVHESARERQRERMTTDAAKERYKQRQHFGETPFAVLKACFDLRRFSLRRLKGVQTEFQWACSAFNTKKLMTLLAALRAGGRSLDVIFECCGV